MKRDDSSGIAATLLASTLVLLTAALSACGGIGKGVLPVSATIQPFGGVLGATSTKAYTCLNTSVGLIITFSNGSSGDFTSRATYTSSNPAVAKVSNLDIAVPDQANTFYSRGTVVPVGTGTTTITAHYLTLSASIDVTVSPIANFRISPASGDVAVNSLLDFSALADLDGVETVVDSAVAWSFVTANDAVATIDAVAGTVKGVSAGNITARARIPACGMTTDAPVAVANLTSLALSREFGSNDKLIVSTTERLIATGTLDNGKTQDLSQQVTYSSSDTTALSFFSGTLLNLGFALKATTSPVQVTAAFASPAISAPAIGINLVTDSLNTITVAPTAVTVGPGRTAQFKATGNYASGATQDITRHVAWTTSDSTVALIQSSASTGINGFAGLATTSNNGSGKSVTVTGSTLNAANQTITATGTLNIQ